MKKNNRVATMTVAIAIAMSANAQENNTISNDSTILYQRLNEVVVKSDLPKVRTNAEGMKVFISGTELEKVGSTKDLLKRLPNVSSADDGVEIFGRGKAEVYVNGRRIYDNQELEQLPSDQIQNVEIITSPGARYAASTKAVVRIKTKRAQGEGWGFRNELKPGYQNGFSISDQLDVNYREGGLDISGMLSGLSRNTKSESLQKITVYHGGQLMEQTMDPMEQDIRTRQISTRLQLNYQFNTNHSIGVRYAFSRTPRLSNHALIPSVFRLDGKLMQESMSQMEQRIPNYQHTANIYYSGKVKQWQLDFNLDGVWNDRKNWNITDEQLSIPGKPTEKQMVNTYNQGTSHLYAAKFVAEHPLLGGSISVGTEYDVTRRVEKNINPSASDTQTRVDENIWSIFAEYNRQLFKKLNLRAGLRMETVKSDYYEWDKHQMDRDYTDFFPSVGLSMPVGKVFLSANYSADIARPSFAYLSNSLIYINSYSYQSGNPYLKPAYTHNLSFTASYKWFYGMLSLSRVKDDIQVKNVSYSADNPLITLLLPANLPTYNRLMLQLVASPTLFKVWHPSWIAVVMAQDYETHKADGNMIKLNHPLAQFMWNNLVDLPHGWRIGFDMLLMTSGDLYTYRLHRPCFCLDASIYKSFFKDKLDVRAQVSDITAVRSQPVTIYSYRDSYTKNVNYPSFELSVVYKFNLAQDKYRGRGAGDRQKSRIQ